MADKKDRKVWCVRGETEDWSGHDLFLTEKVVALDEPFLPDLSQIPPAREMTKEWPPVPLKTAQLKETLEMYGKIHESVKEWDNKPYTPMTKSALSKHVGHLVRLASIAQQGDLVIYPPQPKKEIVYIGEIKGDYFYVACCYQHRRRVNWYEFTKGKLPDKFGPGKGFTAINDKDQAGRIIRKWKSGKK